ncbi:MAG: hypothetical protein ACRDNC_03085 [Gaiellaceae bacterium]
MDRRILVALGAVAAAVVLFVVLRPEDTDETAATEPSTTASTPTTTEVTTETAETTAAPPPTAVRVVVEVRDGGPVGGVQRVQVDRRERVVLVVRSDVADHVHVHGVDIFRNVAPGSPARLQFRPRTPGVLEIELENRHLLIAQLEVRP